MRGDLLKGWGWGRYSHKCPSLRPLGQLKVGQRPSWDPPTPCSPLHVLTALSHFLSLLPGDGGLSSFQDPLPMAVSPAWVWSEPLPEEAYPTCPPKSSFL